MYVVRELMYCKPGKVGEMVKRFKQMEPLMKEAGFGAVRVMTPVCPLSCFGSRWLMKSIIYALRAQMGEVKGGDFASRLYFWRMALSGQAKKHQFAAFFGSRSRKKRKPGDERPRGQKAQK